MFFESCRHLDANLLNAYLEGELGKQDRQRVLAHLSDCAACRQWVSCTQSCSFMPVAPAHSRRVVWMAPIATAASLTLVVSAWWLVRPTVVQAPDDRPSYSAPVKAVAATAPTRKLPSLPAAVSIRHAKAPAPTTLATAEPTPLSLPSPTTPTSSELPPAIDFTPLMTGFQDQAPMGAPRMQLASFTDPQGTVATDAALPLASDPPSSAASPELLPSSPAGNGFAGANMFSSANRDANVSGPMAPAVTAGLGWAISRGGQVVRSVGSGLWAAVPLVPGVRIHALSASDANIWAAGLSNQVYVSTDHGAHWRVVHLPTIGNQTSPIRSIVFSDARHGIITADNGHSWQTSDGGNQWTIARQH